jgi:hypothetical protein
MVPDIGVSFDRHTLTTAARDIITGIVTIGDGWSTLK